MQPIGNKKPNYYIYKIKKRHLGDAQHFHKSQSISINNGTIYI